MPAFGAWARIGAFANGLLLGESHDFRRSRGAVVGIDPGAATNGQLAELLGDLIGHPIEILLAIPLGLIEQLLLNDDRTTEIADAESQQADR